MQVVNDNNKVKSFYTGNTTHTETVSGSLVHMPDYTGVKKEGTHIAIYILLFLAALIGIKATLSTSAPTTKYLVMIIISFCISGFVLLSIFMGWL